MLEWLKTILGDAYSEDIDGKVSAEIGKAFVSRTDFNTANEAKKSLEGQIAERDKQIKGFEKLTGDNEELKTQLKAAQEANKTAKTQYDEQLSKIKIESGVNETIAGRSFVNDFTRDSIKTKILEMVNLEENKGKSYTDLLAALTHDDKGKELPNIFTSTAPGNPPPPAGGAPANQQDDTTKWAAEAGVTLPKT